MKNIIIVPAMDRPEMLALCLRNLSRCEGIRAHEVWVMQDRRHGEHVNSEIPEVVKEAAEYMNVHHELQPPHADLGNKRNYMRSLEKAYETARPFIFAIEEDVIVSTDFLRWSYAVHARGDWFSSSGFGQHGRDEPESYMRRRHFFPLGACFKRDAVGLILEHDCALLYSDTRAYFEKVFSRDPWRGGHYDFAGLCNRVSWTKGLWNATPAQTRCFHTGINGSNRRHDSRLRPGSWRELAAELQARWKDASWMTADYVDCQPDPLNVKPWTTLKERGVNERLERSA